jgi:hypothetical protein
MARKPQTSHTSKRVTKSIRLTPDEAADLTQLVAGTAYAEAALLRQWVLTGMQQFRITEAIRAYQEGAMALRQAAERAQLPVAVFLEELAARKVAVLEAPDAFGPGVEALREAFGTLPEGPPNNTRTAGHSSTRA